MEWQPNPVFLPGELHGQRGLASYSPWGRKELDTTEWLTLSLFICLLVAQTVKNLPTMPGSRVRSLGWEDCLEKEMATHSSILAWPFNISSFLIYQLGTSLFIAWSSKHDCLKALSSCVVFIRPRKDSISNSFLVQIQLLSEGNFFFFNLSNLNLKTSLKRKGKLLTLFLPANS